MTDTHDAVNSPRHYTAHPSSIEAIELIENYMVNLGNAIKYLWRLGNKDAAVQELGKAQWYVKREIDFLIRTRIDLINKVSYVENKGIVLGLIERYLSHEEDGTLKQVKTLVMRAPFFTHSVDALEVAVDLLGRLIREARENETTAGAEL